MIWIKTDVYRAVIAWVFMLVSGILLLSSFGEGGEVTSRTYFYLFLILLPGLFLFITVLKNHTPNSGEEADHLELIDEDELSSGLQQDNAEVNPDNNEPDVEKFADKIISEGEKGEAIGKLAERLLRSLANRLDAVQGIFYAKDNDTDTYKRIADYAFYSETDPPVFKPGETLPGQAVKNKNLVSVNVPDGYMTILSGLGSSYPRHLMIVPFIHEGEAVAVAELASFRPFTEKEEKFMEQLAMNGGNEIVKSLKAG